MSDVTIGDFWGLPGTKDDLFKGISVILVNTPKGAEYLELVKDKLYIEVRTYEEALKGNGCLLTSAKTGVHRQDFFDKVMEMEFEALVWSLLGETKRNIYFQELKYNIKGLLGR